jgi:hypothetical protein
VYDGMNKMLFNFYIDEDKEYDALAYMLSGGDASDTVDRAGQYGIPSDIARPGGALKNYLRKKYAEFGAELKQSLAYHEKFWNQKTSGEYRAGFEKILEHEMPDYDVRLSCQLGGMSDWYGTDISINAFEYLGRFKSGHMIQALVWESMLSQIFQDIRRRWNAEEIDDKKVWGVSELGAVSIYQTDFFKSDWPIGYRELEPYRAAVKKLYASRESFRGFLEKSTELFRGAKGL